MIRMIFGGLIFAPNALFAIIAVVGGFVEADAAMGFGAALLALPGMLIGWLIWRWGQRAEALHNAQMHAAQR